jgi:hypothetical protein
MTRLNFIQGWHVSDSLRLYKIFTRYSKVNWAVVAQLVALQTRRARVRFPMVSLEFFIDIILSVALWPWVDSASNRNEYQEYFLWGQRRPVRRVDNLTTFKCRLSGYLGASTSWKPKGLSRPVMGLLHIFSQNLTQYEIFAWHWHLAGFELFTWH